MRSTQKQRVRRDGDAVFNSDAFDAKATRSYDGDAAFNSDDVSIRRCKTHFAEPRKIHDFVSIWLLCSHSW